jgi:hypothetical protein
MKTIYIKIILFLVVVSSVVITYSQSNNKVKFLLTNHKATTRIQQRKSTIDSSIVRKGIIDLNGIDKNKDGYVYEDLMDYNVISDKPGKCPLCGMALKRVTIAQAKRNLLNAGFKVK